jgi:hypothetical protein
MDGMGRGLEGGRIIGREAGIFRRRSPGVKVVHEPKLGPEALRILARVATTVK